MKILPANPQPRTAVPPRADARTEVPSALRPSDTAAARHGQRMTAPDEPSQPGAVANAHRVERPIPPSGPSGAPRGSIVNLVV